MKDVIICTVGVAMIRNLGNQNAIMTRNAIATATLMKSQFTPSSYECGAEVNSINSIVEKNLVQDKHAIYLLVSDTPDGEFVGEVLRLYYKDELENVYVKTLKGLHDQNFKDFRNHGLCNLVREASDIIKRERNRGHEPVINATGGFKAQISFAGLIGQVLEVPVYYMFEKFSEVIEMPPMPVAFDFSLWLDNFSALEEISERCIVPANDPILNELDPKLSILMYHEGNEVVLSPMGELFYQGFFQRFFREPKIVKPPKSYLKPHGKPRTFPDRPLRGLDKYFDWICEMDYVTKIMTFEHNPDLPSMNKFRRSSRGNDCVEGWFSDGTGTAKFNVFLTSNDSISAQFAIVDLTREMRERGVRI